ncbi:hypothetical protein NW762_012753 [Fusarium torreyae]|uniref:Amidase domain-containing protein n=1 Tax=Fusarium torreyae TaxID=1237075 RepID=A0A9W8RR26_9HYPO|nr:hypothetical protein NW762_012753 [Fusarium torreyae]
MTSFNLVEASIDDLQAALSSGALTSVDLVAQYLRRIALYDCRGVSLNSIPILNLDVFQEAAQSDDLRASGKLRRLEGIPYTVKDSYKVKGMTAAAGSPAFKDLIATEDAFTVQAIRSEGGVLIGRTNMPPMAYGGMQRGCYGRAESPYNPKYLAAAYWSGSSNGSAVSTATSFAAFGMGEETVSSGRSPASNNAVVAYTPSRGWISIRGNWPLYPTCDVVVPHTRTMKDLLAILEVIGAEDVTTTGDFWRDQPFVELPKLWGSSASPNTFRDIGKFSSLQGLRFAVPAMYVGGKTPDGATPVTVYEGVVNVWEDARKHLESLGAEVVIVPDFPAVTAFEHPELLPEGVSGLPENWMWTERGPLIAHGWETFLRTNGDSRIPSIAAVDEFEIFGDSMRSPAELAILPKNNLIHWGKLAKYVQDTRMYEIDGLGDALQTLESLRKRLLDDYLDQFSCDAFIFPAAGDVAAEDSDVESSSAAYAWKNGVLYSHGNRALRHLGIPSVTVPMGEIVDKKMPIGLTFAGKSGEDVNLLKWANAFETKNQLRTLPSQTPPLGNDSFTLAEKQVARASRPVLQVSECVGSPHDTPDYIRVSIKGIVRCSVATEDTVNPIVEVVVAGEDVPQDQIKMKHESTEKGSVSFEACVKVMKPAQRSDRETTMAPIARDQTMVVVLARSAPQGYPSGYLGLV